MIKLLLTILLAAVALYFIMIVVMGGIATFIGIKSKLSDRAVDHEIERRRRLFGRGKDITGGRSEKK